MLPTEARVKAVRLYRSSRVSLEHCGADPVRFSELLPPLIVSGGERDPDQPVGTIHPRVEESKKGPDE